MAFDPSKPANGAPIVSAELRNQFTGLKTLIDAVQTQANNLPTLGDVNVAITQNSAGPCPGFAYLSLMVSDPPTQAEVQAIADRLDELIALLKRT